MEKVILSHRMSQNEIRNLQNAKPNFASYPQGITFVSSATERVQEKTASEQTNLVVNMQIQPPWARCCLTLNAMENGTESSRF